MMNSLILHRPSPTLHAGGTLARTPGRPGGAGGLTGAYAEIVEVGEAAAVAWGPHGGAEVVPDADAADIITARGWVPVTDPEAARAADEATRARVDASEHIFRHTFLVPDPDVPAWRMWLQSVTVDSDATDADWSLRYTDGTTAYAVAALATSLRDAQRMGANLDAVNGEVTAGRDWAQVVLPVVEAPLSLHSRAPIDTGGDYLYGAGGGYQTSLTGLSRGEAWSEMDIASAAGLTAV